MHPFAAEAFVGRGKACLNQTPSLIISLIFSPRSNPYKEYFVREKKKKKGFLYKTSLITVQTMGSTYKNPYWLPSWIINPNLKLNIHYSLFIIGQNSNSAVLL